MYSLGQDNVEIINLVTNRVSSGSYLQKPTYFSTKELDRVLK